MAAPYVVSLRQFDGPLDLLLQLITRAKLDICDIFVSEITEQYVAHMSLVNDLDMEAASEFLQMAATLLEIKSRALLPTVPAEIDPDEETPEQALIRQLTEYKAFREVSLEMQLLEAEAGAILTKLPEEYPLPPPAFELTGLTLSGLAAAFSRVLKRAADRKDTLEVPDRAIRRDQYTVQSCMFRILKQLRGGQKLMFSSLFDEKADKPEVISIFLALLELLKLGRVNASQAHTYSDIELSA